VVKAVDTLPARCRCGKDLAVLHRTETPTATKRPAAQALRYAWDIRRSQTRPAVYRGVLSMPCLEQAGESEQQ